MNRSLFGYGSKVSPVAAGGDDDGGSDGDWNPDASAEGECRGCARAQGLRARLREKADARAADQRAAMKAKDEEIAELKLLVESPGEWAKKLREKRDSLRAELVVEKQTVRDLTVQLTAHTARRDGRAGSYDAAAEIARGRAAAVGLAGLQPWSHNNARAKDGREVAFSYVSEFDGGELNGWLCVSKQRDGKRWEKVFVEPGRMYFVRGLEQARYVAGMLREGYSYQHVVASKEMRVQLVLNVFWLDTAPLVVTGRAKKNETARKKRAGPIVSPVARGRKRGADDGEDGDD